MIEHCFVCGTKLSQKSERVWWCERCQNERYANPSPAAEVIFCRDNQMLISERAIDPGKGTFDVPGGFVELHENLETALLREVEEELGITKEAFSTPVYLRSYTVSYPYGNTVYQVLVSVYIADLKSGIVPTANDDVASLRWISADEINTIQWSQPEQLRNAEIALLKHK